jgi:hypothetical protein
LIFDEGMESADIATNENILFAHSSDPTEFWVSLVEKAYAK